MKLSHKGMGITKDDYAASVCCLSATLDAFEVPEPERGEVVTFITSQSLSRQARPCRQTRALVSALLEGHSCYQTGSGTHYHD